MSSSLSLLLVAGRASRVPFGLSWARMKMGFRASTTWFVRPLEGFQGSSCNDVVVVVVVVVVGGREGEWVGTVLGEDNRRARWRES